MERNSCRCKHPTQSIHSYQSNQTYCAKCGVIIESNSPSKLKPLMKPLNLEKATDSNPLSFLKGMENYLESHKLSTHSEWYLYNREKAVIFLKSLCSKYRATDKTFFTSLHYLDIVMNRTNEPLLQNQFDLQIIACFILAGKFSENDSYPFDLNHITSVNGNYLFNSSAIIQAEIDTLNQLNYNLTDITPYEYLMTLLHCGIVLDSELENNDDEDDLNNIYTFCLKILTKIVLSEAFIKFNPFQLSFSIVYLTRRHFGLSFKNMSVINQLFNVQYCEYIECAEFISKLFDNAKREKTIKESKEDSIEEIKKNLIQKHNDIPSPLPHPAKKIQQIKVVRHKIRTNSLSTKWDSQRTVTNIEGDSLNNNNSHNNNLQKYKVNRCIPNYNAKINNINEGCNGHKSISVTKKFISENKVHIFRQQIN